MSGLVLLAALSAPAAAPPVLTETDLAVALDRASVEPYRSWRRELVGRGVPEARYWPASQVSAAMDAIQFVADHPQTLR